MNLTLSLGISNNGGTTRKRKLWDGVDDVGDGGSGGDRGRVIMRLLQAREERMTARLETDDDPSRAAACSDNTDDDAGGGIRLMRLLLSSAAASEAGDARAAAAALREVYRRASFGGGDPAQRVAAYFADALASSSRILILSPAAAAPPPPTSERRFLAYTMFYQASPMYQLAHFTANQAIVEAFEAGARRRRLHVVDFDVAYGFQWPSLIQSLSDAAAATTSTSGSGSSSDGSCDEPVSLRITGLGTSADELRRTEARLTRFASGCPNLRFEFEGIVVDNGASRDGIINIKTDDDETVVVNLVFPDARNSSSREECGTLLARVRSLNPALVFLVEKHDGSGNATSTITSSLLLPRFTASLRYFAAVFDSLHECLPADSAERLAIERNHLGAEISSAVASLLHEQHRHDDDDGHTANTWKEMMESAGFEGVKLSSRTVSQARLLLKMKSGCCGGGGFRVVEEDAGKAMSLGWRDSTALITATAWRRRSTSWAATHKFID
ncbi:hypothetical protein QOZ80_4BG0348610 [Eleusine coracana subsp. coracana]|nr:hypothetical protein QOZ80_4BG0348610 [Eleusine coracana subsp. coracana]